MINTIWMVKANLLCLNTDDDPSQNFQKSVRPQNSSRSKTKNQNCPQKQPQKKENSDDQKILQKNQYIIEGFKKQIEQKDDIIFELKYNNPEVIELKNLLILQKQDISLMRQDLIEKNMEILTIKKNLENEVLQRAQYVIDKKIEQEKFENFIKQQNEAYMDIQNDRQGLQMMCNQLDNDKMMMADEIMHLKMESTCLTQQYDIEKDNFTQLQDKVKNFQMIQMLKQKEQDYDIPNQFPLPNPVEIPNQIPNNRFPGLNPEAQYEMSRSPFKYDDNYQNQEGQNYQYEDEKPVHKNQDAVYHAKLNNSNLSSNSQNYNLQNQQQEFIQNQEGQNQNIIWQQITVPPFLISKQNSVQNSSNESLIKKSQSD